MEHRSYLANLSSISGQFKTDYTQRPAMIDIIESCIKN